MKLSILAHMTGLKLRTPLIADSSFLYEIRNSTASRRYSLNSSPIEIHEHDVWFKSRMLRHPDEPFWVAYNDEGLIGYVRFDLTESNIFVISLGLGESSLGIGLGYVLLKESVKTFFDYFPDSRITAKVHKNNEPSLKIFSRAGFHKIGYENDFEIFQFGADS